MRRTEAAIPLRTLHSIVGCGLALLTLAPAPVLADELLFGPPQYLTGDGLVGPAAGMQMEADIALGDGQFLAVWSDFRSSPDDYPPFASEGSGADIYGMRMDADGSVLDAVPFAIDSALGDQTEPRVAWNGDHWLVLWKQETVTLPTYEELLAVRVAPDGTVLDDTPIEIYDDESYFSATPVLEGGDGEWLALFHVNGTVDGLLAVRIGGDGTVVNPGGLLVHSTSFLLEFDVAFAGDEYLVVWSGSFDSPRGRRYTTDLQDLGIRALPFAQRVASDGSDFLVVRASGPPPLATVDAVQVAHDGTVQSPFTLFTGGNQAGTCCADVTWDGIQFWVSWGGPNLARVTPEGGVLDPGGFLVQPSQSPISNPRYVGAPGGGVQLIYNDGVNGADYPKDVHAARISPSGQFGSETLVSRGAPAQLEADFAPGDGTHLVVFASRSSDDGRILAQRIDDGGTALDPEPIEVASGPIPGLGLPSLGAPRAAWNGSVFLVTWSDGLAIYARRMLPDGSFLDGAPLIVMDGHDPDVAAVGSVFLVVGLDFLEDNPHWQATHSMRVDGTTGTNLDAEPNALGGFVIFARHPRVENWGDRWLAVWQRNLSHDNTIAGTTAAVVEADGTTPGVIDVPLGWRPQVAVSGDTALFVAVTNTIASATTDLAGILMSSDGTFPGSSFPISEAPDKQLRPAVASNGSEFVVAWEDKRTAVIYFDERTDIYASRVSIDGTVLDPAGVPVAAKDEPELQPALASIGGRVFLGASTLVPGAGLSAYRIGLQGSLSPASIDEGPESLGRVRLLGAHPNPSRSGTAIRFEVGDVQPVDLRIFDAQGRLVRTLAASRVFAAGPGAIEIPWDGRDESGRRVNSGVFYYELRTPGTTQGERLVLLR